MPRAKKTIPAVESPKTETKQIPDGITTYIPATRVKGNLTVIHVFDETRTQNGTLMQKVIVKA
jgi:hypothetical protein